MTRDDVKARVGEIARVADDDEWAHREEDELYRNLLAAIATGKCEDPAGCAAEALKTVDIGFCRLFA